MHKICSKCKSLRSISEFGKCISSKDGLKSYCKICISKYNYDNREHIRKKCKLYRINNLEKEKLRDKNNWLKNKNKRITQQKVWIINNRKRIRTYYSNKLKTDINFKIASTIRSRIRDVVKKVKLYKITINTRSSWVFYR